MRHYWHIFTAYLRYNLAKDYEYRVNTVFWAVMNFVYLLVTLTAVNILFGQYQSIAGWNKDQVLLLLYVAALFNDILWVFIYPSVKYHYADAVRTGSLDLILTKPVSARFLNSIRYFGFSQSLRPVLLVYLIISQAHLLALIVSIPRSIGFITLLMGGLIIAYNFIYSFTTLIFWFSSLFNADAVYSSVTDLAKYPADIWRDRASRIVFLYLIPSAFVAYYPVSYLMGRMGNEALGITLFAFLVSSLFSQWFWRVALKRYSSVSS